MARKTSTTAANSASMEISFHQSKERPAVRYVSATTVCEEALQNSRWLGLYWSAGGQVQRENVTKDLPSLNPSEFPLQVFDLEIDGQDLRNGWEWVGALERSGARAGTREAVVELRHQVRPITIKMVTRLDGTPFFARAGWRSWAERRCSGWRGATTRAVSPTVWGGRAF